MGFQQTISVMLASVGKVSDRSLPSELACVANVSERKRLSILTPKQMFQILPIALAQVKAGNTSENLLDEIRSIIYSLYRAKEIT